MKKPFAAEARTYIARWAMRQAAEFVALVAPWLALPTDRRMSRALLIAIIVVVGLGFGMAGYYGLEIVQAILPQRQEAVP